MIEVIVCIVLTIIAIRVGIYLLSAFFSAFKWILSVTGRLLINCMKALPVWVVLFFIPSFIDEVVFAVVLLYLAIVDRSLLDLLDDIISPRLHLRRNSADEHDEPYMPYVLNTRTGVIHDRWSRSADTISPDNRIYLTYEQSQELTNRGDKYRWKN